MKMLLRAFLLTCALLLLTSGNLHAQQKATEQLTIDVYSYKLTWNASTCTGSCSGGITGYNVYRATKTGGPYTKISGSSGVTVTQYFDPTVVPGTTYYYVVTSFNANGESGYSNQWTAVIPSD
jgi:fibronectin type 3 domain-containing protein